MKLFICKEFRRLNSEVVEFDSQSSPNIMVSDPVFESAMGILEGEVVVKNKKSSSC